MRAQEKASARGQAALPQQDALLKLETVLELVPVSRATWFRGVKEGRFPQPRRIGGNTFWHTRDIRYLINHGTKPKVRAQRASRQVN